MAKQTRIEAAELLKEQIYSSITLVALIVTLWQSADHITAKGAAISIVGTAIALWLAIAIASRMSYQVVNGRSISTREVGRILATRKALLTPAIAPLFFIFLSVVTPLSLKTALFIGIISQLFSFAIFSIIAGRKIRTTWFEIVLSLLLEIALGVGVVVLKIVVGH